MFITHVCNDGRCSLSDAKLLRVCSISSDRVECRRWTRHLTLQARRIDANFLKRKLTRSLECNRLPRTMDIESFRRHCNRLEMHEEGHWPTTPLLEPNCWLENI